MTRFSISSRSGIAAALLFICQQVFANTFLPGDGIDSMGILPRLAAGCGIVLPSVSLPFSRDTAARVLDDLAAASTCLDSAPDVAALAERYRSLDVPFIDVSLQLDYEQYIRPADHSLSSADFPELLGTVDPLALLRMSYQVNNATVLCIAVAAQSEYNNGVFQSNFFRPVSGNPVSLENNSIIEGYLQSSVGNFNLTFGRQKIHIGPSPANSLLLSRRIPYLDALNLRGYFGPLTMTLIVSTLENRKATPDVVPPDDTYAFGQTVILSNTHYFEWSFGEVRAGIGAQYLAVRPANAFHVADFFPVMSWHQSNLVPNNLSLVADFSWAPGAGFTVYGQGGMDDISLAAVGVSDSTVPSIPAFLLGASWQGSARDSMMTAGVEVGYTHYLWGNFDDDVPLARAIYRMDIDRENRSIPLTSPYGPGSIWASASFAISTPWRLDAEARVRYVLKNPEADLTDTPYESSDVIASASLAQWLQCGLEVRWEPMDWFRVSAAPELNLSNGECWFALTLGGTIRLDTMVMLDEGRRGKGGRGHER